MMTAEAGRLQKDQLYVEGNVMLSPNIIGIESHTLGGQYKKNNYKVHFHLRRNEMGSSVTIHALHYSIGVVPTKRGKVKSGHRNSVTAFTQKYVKLCTEGFKRK